MIEGSRFLPEISPISPTALLQEILKETLPWAIAVGSEKARSEGIINPVVLEVKHLLLGQQGGRGAEEKVLRRSHSYNPHSAPSTVTH